MKLCTYLFGVVSGIWLCIVVAFWLIVYTLRCREELEAEAEEMALEEADLAAGGAQ